MHTGANIRPSIVLLMSWKISTQKEEEDEEEDLIIDFSVLTSGGSQALQVPVELIGV